MCLGMGEGGEEIPGGFWKWKPRGCLGREGRESLADKTLQPISEAITYPGLLGRCPCGWPLQQ